MRLTKIPKRCDLQKSFVKTLSMNVYDSPDKRVGLDGYI